MQRRDFLRGAASASLMSTTALIITLPTPARAAILTTIVAVIGFVSAVASMFARPDGTAQQFSILNAKLDAILFSQQKTLAALTEISEQISELKDAIPQIEVNEDLRQKYVDVLAELRKLRAALVQIDLGNANDETVENIDNVVIAIYEQSGHFVDNLGTIEVGNASDVVTMELSRRILAAMKEFLPAFYAADAELGQKAARLDLHQQKYQFISNQILLACGRLRTHTATSLVYHQSQNAIWQGRIQSNSYWKQWSATIDANHVPAAGSEARKRFSAAQRFAAMQYMGACAHGWSTNDIEQARPRGRVMLITTSIDAPWSAYVLTLPGTLSGEASYFAAEYMGLLEINFDAGAATATRISTVAIDDVVKIDRTAGALTLPRIMSSNAAIGRFYCPGTADGDRTKHAGANAITYARSLPATWQGFQEAIQWRTYQNWVIKGLAELDRELQNLIVESASAQQVALECEDYRKAEVPECS